MPAPDPRAARILRAALDLPRDERSAWVRAQCAGDEALAAHLARLLELDSATSLPLDHGADPFATRLLAELGGAEAAPQLQPETRIGPYRLLRELGRGGMGAVWLAERADGEFTQRVALKLVKFGMDSPHVERQFRRERDLLARLQHPNIARLLDGGIDPSGRPWFAMEFIAGLELGAWLVERQPDLHTRLVLFAKLCRAVAHAHRQLIVHRDLKPSNVLVEANGEPRLLDFGIARLEEPEGTERTATAQRFLTRDFAAPEQLRGEVAGTSADVYALGLILFELLTGQRYRKLHHAGDATLRPSNAMGGTTANPTATPITRTQLRGDLDAITLRALAEEPARRYPDAQQLADDVARYLAGEPIHARPDSFAYRAGKFLRRNRAAVAVGAFGLAAFLAAGGIAIQQAVRKGAEAERARLALRQAEAVRDFALSMIAEADPTRARGGDTTVRDLLASARTHIAHELADEPAVAAELLDQIGNAYVSLGDIPASRETLVQALAWNARAPEPSPLIAASAGGRLAYFRFQDGDAAAALGELDRLVAALAGQDPQQADVAAELGKLHELRGSVLYATGRKQEARAAGEAAVAAWRPARHRKPTEYLMAEVSLADLEAALGNGASALALAEEVLADPLFGDEHVPPALRANARGVRVRALQALERHAAAAPLLADTVAEFSDIYGADASMTRYWRFRQAETLHALGRLEEAQRVADAILALPSDGTAAYRRIRVEVLAARIARDRHAGDAARRIAAAMASACAEGGNAELCTSARALVDRG